MAERDEAGLPNAAPVLYHEGRGVVHNPTVHLILWGSNFKSTQEGREVQEILTKLYTGLSHTSYEGILTQYFDATGRVGPVVTFDTNVYLDETVAAPQNVSESGVEAELDKAIEAKKWPATTTTSTWS